MKSNVRCLVKESLMKKFYHFDLRIPILNCKLMFIKNRVWQLSRKTIFGQIVFIDRRISQGTTKIIKKKCQTRPYIINTIGFENPYFKLPPNIHQEQSMACE